LRTPIARFALNFALYLVFGGGMLAFAAMHDATPERASTSTVILAALVLALWCGALSTAGEHVNLSAMPQLRRAVLAGVLGALSLGGFAIILSLLAWHGVPALFVGIGVLAGGLLHGARAFSRGGPPVDDDVPDDVSDDGPADEGDAGPA
jgi:hypothetical protein